MQSELLRPHPEGATQVHACANAEVSIAEGRGNQELGEIYACLKRPLSAADVDILE
jgi:hypothetical protein